MTPAGCSTKARTQTDVRLILSHCKEEVARQLGTLFKDFFQRAESHLFLCARDAKSNVEQREFFDATLTLKNEWQRIELEISDVLLTRMDRVGTAEKPDSKAPTSEQSGEFSLLDPGELERLIAIAKCVSKAETLYKIPLHQLAQRLTYLLAVKVDKGNLPVAPTVVCDAFSNVLTSLNLNWVQMKQIYEALENVVIPHLGEIYKNLNELLDQQGISLGMEYGRHPPQQASPDRQPKQGQCDQTTPAEAQAHIHPEPIDPGFDRNRGTRGAARACLGKWVNPGDGRIPVSQYGAGFEERGKSRYDSYDKNTTQGVYHPVQTLWALQRHAKPAALNETAGSPRSSDTLGMPAARFAADTARPFYDPVEITNAFALLQPELETLTCGSGNLNIKERLLSVLASQQGGSSGKCLGESESMAIDMVADLLSSIDQDPLLGDPVKSQIRRLQLPIYNAVLSDPSFLETESHPARQVLNKLAWLQISLSGQENTQSLEQHKPAIDRLIEQVIHRSTRDPKVFAEVLAELDQLIEAGNRECSENLAQVVRECEQQQSFLKARCKDSEDLSDPGRMAHFLAQDLPEAVRAEWTIWLECAKGLRIGDAITVNKGSGLPQRLGLAWIGENHHPYVFVDGHGRKASTMSLQELAMQLRSGTITLPGQAELSVVDRALHSVLYKLHSQLWQQTLRDPLTGLESRKKFMERLDQAVVSASQEHARHILGYLRLDRFDLLADKYGPQAMNPLLKRLAEWLARHVGDRGYLARVNDNEFAVLFERCSLEQGRELAKRQVESLAKVQIRYKQETFTISTSMGLAEVVGKSDSAEALLQMAASACLAASAAGGNCVHEYRAAAEPIQQEQTTWGGTPSLTLPLVKGEGRGGGEEQGKIYWQEWLDRPLDERPLTLYYQRIAPIKQEQRHPPYYAILPGIPGPADLLPEDLSPEYASKIQLLDRQIIQTTLQWMAGRREQLDNLGTYIIKLSRYALQDDQLLESIIEQLIHSQVPPSKICFELQETAVVASLSQAQRLVRTLKECGCRFSLSGFGVAAATQDYLNQLAIDYFTIEGMLVKEIVRSPADYVMVKSTNEIGHLLGKKTIAHDVETEDLLERLREIGVDYVRGPVIEAPCLMEEVV